MFQIIQFVHCCANTVLKISLEHETGYPLSEVWNARQVMQKSFRPI